MIVCIFLCTYLAVDLRDHLHNMCLSRILNSGNLALAPQEKCLGGTEEEMLAGIWQLYRHKPVRQQELRGLLASALGECQMAT